MLNNDNVMHRAVLLNEIAAAFGLDDSRDNIGLPSPQDFPREYLFLLTKAAQHPQKRLLFSYLLSYYRQDLLAIPKTRLPSMTQKITGSRSGPAALHEDPCCHALGAAMHRFLMVDADYFSLAHFVVLAKALAPRLIDYFLFYVLSHKITLDKLAFSRLCVVMNDFSVRDNPQEFYVKSQHVKYIAHHFLEDAGSPYHRIYKQAIERLGHRGNFFMQNNALLCLTAAEQYTHAATALLDEIKNDYNKAHASLVPSLSEPCLRPVDASRRDLLPSVLLSIIFEYAAPGLDFFTAYPEHAPQTLLALANLAAVDVENKIHYLESAMEKIESRFSPWKAYEDCYFDIGFCFAVALFTVIVTFVPVVALCCSVGALIITGWVALSLFTAMCIGFGLSSIASAGNPQASASVLSPALQASLGAHDIDLKDSEDDSLTIERVLGNIRGELKQLYALRQTIVIFESQDVSSTALPILEAEPAPVTPRIF